MTLGRQVARLRAALQAGGVGGHEARLIAQHVLGLDATAFALALSEPVADAAVARMEAIAQARLAHRPLQLLLGQCAFYGLPMAVAEGVLIPRPDTEILVEACLERMGPAGRALDLCCGSGCVGVALAHERPHWRVDGADLDGAALALSARNAQRNGVAGRMRFFQGDLFAALPEGRYDLIACNPPYIPTGDIPGPVSYTHLDVYKRQPYPRADSAAHRRAAPTDAAAGPYRRAGPHCFLPPRPADQRRVGSAGAGLVSGGRLCPGRARPRRGRGIPGSLQR